MNKYLVPLFVGVVLTLLVSGTYYVAVQLPAQQIAEAELLKIESLKQEGREKEINLNFCLDEARLVYSDRWKSACVRLGRKTDEDGWCGLPSEQAKHYDSEYKNLREECLARYK